MQMFFLLKKVLFSRSAFQALTKQATKGICIGVFVKGSQNFTGHLVFTYFDTGGRLIERLRDNRSTGINILTEAMASNKVERLQKTALHCGINCFPLIFHTAFKQ